jgi:hypothetical protein
VIGGSPKNLTELTAKHSLALIQSRPQDRETEPSGLPLETWPPTPSRACRCLSQIGREAFTACMDRCHVYFDLSQPQSAHRSRVLCSLILCVCVFFPFPTEYLCLDGIAIRLKRAAAFFSSFPRLSRHRPYSAKSYLHLHLHLCLHRASCIAFTLASIIAPSHPTHPPWWQRRSIQTHPEIPRGLSLSLSLSLPLSLTLNIFPSTLAYTHQRYNPI